MFRDRDNKLYMVDDSHKLVRLNTNYQVVKIIYLILEYRLVDETGQYHLVNQQSIGINVNNLDIVSNILYSDRIDKLEFKLENNILTPLSSSDELEEFNLDNHPIECVSDYYTCFMYVAILTTDGRMRIVRRRRSRFGPIGDSYAIHNDVLGEHYLDTPSTADAISKSAITMRYYHDMAEVASNDDYLAIDNIRQFEVYGSMMFIATDDNSIYRIVIDKYRDNGLIYGQQIVSNPDNIELDLTHKLKYVSTKRANHS